MKSSIPIARFRFTCLLRNHLWCLLFFLSSALLSLRQLLFLWLCTFSIGSRFCTNSHLSVRSGEQCFLEYTISLFYTLIYIGFGYDLKLVSWSLWKYTWAPWRWEYEKSKFESGGICLYHFSSLFTDRILLYKFPEIFC
jgi:hypothetical protein